MTRNQRVTLLGVAAVVLVGAFIVLRSGSDSSDGTNTSTNAPATTGTSTNGAPAPPAPPPPKVVTVKDAKPVGGVKTFTWKKGDTIDLIVRSDTADEVHFHGYDIAKDVSAGGSVRFRMKATIDGRFEVELENRKVQIATVDILP
jgi:hypothetical protein